MQFVNNFISVARFAIYIKLGITKYYWKYVLVDDLNKAMMKITIRNQKSLNISKIVEIMATCQNIQIWYKIIIDVHSECNRSILC